ncbi:MAG: lactate utilization protein [Deltaproteobacteria bacterium]|nr:lactate utilization protein [Deltaproteobacteria bacterium]
MENPSEHCWISRCDRVKKALEANGFEVFLAERADDAASIVLGTIIPGVRAVEPHGQEAAAPVVRRNPSKFQSSFDKASDDTRIPPPPGDHDFLRRRVKVAWGGSKTFRDTGLYRAVKREPGLECLDPFARGVSLDQSMDLRRKALLSDLFITGTNAVTETGRLVNLDRTGNRVAAISFGPKWVAILAGRNKIVPDLVDAVRRVKTYAAPLVTMWLGAKTPCARTGICQECSAPERVCNTWSILEKSYPRGRVKVILINEDLGF